MSGAEKPDFRPYIPRDTSSNENYEYGYPHSSALLQSRLKLEPRGALQDAHHPTKFDKINDIKLFPTVYHRIYSISQDILSQIFDVIQSDVVLQKQVH